MWYKMRGGMTFGEGELTGNGTRGMRIWHEVINPNGTRVERDWNESGTKVTHRSHDTRATWEWNESDRSDMRGGMTYDTI